MSSAPPPSSPSFRTRVALPIPAPSLPQTRSRPLPAPKLAPPVLHPVQAKSLIPLDVLNEVERENAEVVLSAEVLADIEPRTSPTPVDEDDHDVAFVTQAPADEKSAMTVLAEVSLFRDLPKSSLRALAQHAEFVDVPDGEPLFVEGEEATGFYVVIDGTFEIARRKDGRQVALRHDGVGAALGLFGLFSAQLRAATARAIGDAIVLQVSADKLNALLETDEALNDRLWRYYRERLLESFMASRLFADLDSIARARLIGRFKSKTLERGLTLLQPGEVANVLAVVTHGRLMLEERSRVGAEPKLFEVLPGQFLAVMCAVSGQPSRMRVFAPEYATVEMLAHKDFAELSRDFPALRSLGVRLPKFGRQLDRDVYCGSTGVPGM